MLLAVSRSQPEICGELGTVRRESDEVNARYLTIPRIPRELTHLSETSPFPGNI
jgi:hypothetical protein